MRRQGVTEAISAWKENVHGSFNLLALESWGRLFFLGEAEEALTEAVFALRQELTGRVTERLVGEVHRDTLAQQTLLCPPWGRRLHAQGPYPRPVETRVGPVRLSRPYIYCQSSQEGFYPLDDALQLAERGRGA
jgi:hypothetical protein